MAGALGLEYMRGTDRWEEVGAHGHAVVTVLGGAVLDRITGGRYKACRHRVVMVPPPLGAAADTAEAASRPLRGTTSHLLSALLSFALILTLDELHLGSLNQALAVLDV